MVTLMNAELRLLIATAVENSKESGEHVGVMRFSRRWAFSLHFHPAASCLLVSVMMTIECRAI